VNPELQALLIVQADDEIIRGIEARQAALAPRIAQLDAARRRAAEDVQRSESALERELTRQRALEASIADHKQRHEKNVAILNQAQKLKEATAAAAQLEAARRVLADEESELLSSTRRITDLRTALTAHQEVLETVSAQQADARRTLASERAALDAELATARAKRAESASGVGKSLLSKYDRVSGHRRTAVVFELYGDYCCGACDTAIPLQRRPAMSTGMVIEPCEGCGVLLYYRPVPAPTPG
jgi:predicted  nucleic acid-binding Zn-ribbon protein